MKGYKTYLASGGLALLAILHAILSDPSVANWMAAGKELLIAAAIAALRSAVGSQWSGLLNLVRELLERFSTTSPGLPVPTSIRFPLHSLPTSSSVGISTSNSRSGRLGRPTEPGGNRPAAGEVKNTFLRHDAVECPRPAARNGSTGNSST